MMLMRAFCAEKSRSMVKAETIPREQKFGKTCPTRFARWALKKSQIKMIVNRLDGVPLLSIPSLHPVGSVSNMIRHLSWNTTDTVDSSAIIVEGTVLPVLGERAGCL